MKPQRKCIGCNTSKDKDLLCRYVEIDGDLVRDINKKLPGRGCYLCDNDKCIELAKKKKAFNRALRKEISAEALGRCFNDR